MLAKALLPLLLIVVPILALACDPTEPIVWVNETDVGIRIYLGDGLDDFSLALSPHSSQTAGTLESFWEDVIVIRDAQDRVLFRQEITWEELEAQGFRFVITDDVLSPTPPRSTRGFLRQTGYAVATRLTYNSPGLRQDILPGG